MVAIDPERERISLSVKQLAKDPFSTWIAEHPKGSIVRGLVREVDAKGAIVDLGGDAPVVVGDGEVQEGAIWEAAMAGAKWKLDNLTAILDLTNTRGVRTVERISMASA